MNLKQIDDELNRITERETELRARSQELLEMRERVLNVDPSTDPRTALIGKTFINPEDMTHYKVLSAVPGDHESVWVLMVRPDPEADRYLSATTWEYVVFEPGSWLRLSPSDPAEFERALKDVLAAVPNLPLEGI